jgi:hypothetical protein
MSIPARSDVISLAIACFKSATRHAQRAQVEAFADCICVWRRIRKHADSFVCPP